MIPWIQVLIVDAGDIEGVNTFYAETKKTTRNY